MHTLEEYVKDVTLPRVDCYYIKYNNCGATFDEYQESNLRAELPNAMTQTVIGCFIVLDIVMLKIARGTCPMFLTRAMRVKITALGF